MSFGYAAPELAVADQLRNRFRGLLLGLALGDALGVSVQFRRPGTFAALTEPLGGGPYELPRGAWSDDTATALQCAESLIELGDLSAADLIDRWRGWRRSGWGSATGRCVGISAAMAAALAETEPAPLLQVNDAEPLPRVAVAAAFEFADSFAVERAAESVTAVTHPAAAVLDAARIFAACIACAVQGEPASALPEALPSQVALRDVSGGTTALGALQRIVSAVRATENFKDAVLLVVNAGGNADVAGAAVGALAGALYGADGIPERWLAALVDRQDIEICADRLLMAALERMIADPVDRTD